MPPGFPRGHIPLFPVAAAVRNYLVRSAIIERAGVGNDMLDLRFVGKQRQLADMPPTEDRKSTRLTPVTNAHLVCRLLLEKKKHTNTRALTYKHIYKSHRQ